MDCKQKRFIKDNHKVMTIPELSRSVGLSTDTVRKYMRSKSLSIRSVYEEKISRMDAQGLRSYSGSYTINELANQIDKSGLTIRKYLVVNYLPFKKVEITRFLAENIIENYPLLTANELSDRTGLDYLEVLRYCRKIGRELPVYHRRISDKEIKFVLDNVKELSVEDIANLLHLETYIIEDIISKGKIQELLIS